MVYKLRDIQERFNKYTLKAPKTNRSQDKLDIQALLNENSRLIAVMFRWSGLLINAGQITVTEARKDMGFEENRYIIDPTGKYDLVRGHIVRGSGTEGDPFVLGYN